jgi:hypothetical protein
MSNKCVSSPETERLEEDVKLGYTILKKNCSTSCSTSSVTRRLIWQDCYSTLIVPFAHYWMHRLQAILEGALGKRRCCRNALLNSIEEFIERFPGVERVMIDGTERPIQRPQDPEQQKLNYSGKKRRHTRGAPSSSRSTPACVGVNSGA